MRFVRYLFGFMFCRPAVMLAVCAVLAFAGVAFADVTATASTLQGVLSDSAPLLEQISKLPLGTMLGLVTCAGLVLAFALEHGLEAWIMPHVPANIEGWFKPLLPYLSMGFAVALASLKGGMALGPALWGGFVAAIGAVKLHDGLLSPSTPAEPKP